MKERKLFQWAIAYLAGAWVLVEATGHVVEQFSWPQGVSQVVTILAFFGFFVVLVIAWYHSEKGRQWVSGAELLIIALLLLISGGVLSTLKRGEGTADPRAADPPRIGEEGGPSIAVLPCENFSPDPGDAYFASGIHEEILLRLSKISGLRSVGRESVQWYRDHPQPMRQMAQELGVGYVGECSVRKDVETNQIRLTFQLLDGNTGTQLWAENYDESLSARSIFDIQSDVALQVAQAVGATFTPEDRAQIAGGPTDDLDAYNAYLLGRFWWNRRTDEALQRAIGYFEEAIELDNAYAMAYSGLADCYSGLGGNGAMPAHEAYPRAREAALRALELDETLGEAHTSLSLIQRRFDWDLDAALQSTQRAIQLNPRYATAYQWHGHTYRELGRTAEAMVWLERGLELDPLSLIINRSLGRVSFVAGEYDRAIEHSESTLEMDPQFVYARVTLGMALLYQGRSGEGIRELQRVVEMSDSSPAHLALLGHAHGLAGHESEAGRVLQWLEEKSKERWIDPMNMTVIYAGMRDVDSAFTWLDRALELRSPHLIDIIAWPMYADLRTDPRYLDLLARIGIGP